MPGWVPLNTCPGMMGGGSILSCFYNSRLSKKTWVGARNPAVAEATHRFAGARATSMAMRMGKVPVISDANQYQYTRKKHPCPHDF